MGKTAHLGRRPADGSGWREIRDDRGRLYARVDERRLLLELSRGGVWVVFDLREYIVILRGVEVRDDPG